ncbi:MAG: membrane dipeptidase [Rhodobacteraceae bacterium]|nr:membrane dipeptidase [Paracoccaceae bacterium]
MIFDGHNDALSRLWKTGGDPVEAFASGGHVSIKAAKAGGLGGGFFAMFSSGSRQMFDFSALKPDGDSMPFAAPMDQTLALRDASEQAGVARRLHEAGALRICLTGTELRETMAAGQMACLLHLEGADCIDHELLVLDLLYAAGLRSLGPVWSRNTDFGEGVPFVFGQGPDTGGGLTDLGRALVARCMALNMVIDTSHITERGFWDIGDLGAPLVATHSNACAITNTTRNLTDAQLRAVGETGGMVGLNFGTLFLSKSGWFDLEATTDDMIRHLDHMMQMAGEDHVGLGSDFDGAPLPQGIASAADLPVLVEAMSRAGYGSELIEKLTCENWLRFLTRQLG